MTSATDELRRLLDERGVEYFKHEDGEPLRKLEKADEPATSWHMGGASVCAVPIKGSNLFDLWIDHITPEQAIAATLGNEGVGRSNDGVAELEAGTCRRVYLVEVSDELIESWCPLSVYLHREAAEDCAKALRKEEDGILQFARVSELKVVDDG